MANAKAKAIAQGHTRPQLKKRAFLKAYAATGNISDAASQTGIDRGTHYKWLKDDAEYGQAFENAKEQAVDILELEARRRAATGWLEPVFWQGEIVGRVRKFSDILLIFLLKGARPGKYRENVRLSGDEDQPLVFKFVDPRGNSDSRAKPRP